MTMGAGKSEMHTASQQAGDQVRVDATDESPKAWTTRISALQSEDTIPLFTRNLKFCSADLQLIGWGPLTLGDNIIHCIYCSACMQWAITATTTR